MALRTIAVTLLCVSACCAENLTVSLVNEDLLRNRLASGAAEHRERETVIRQLFSDAGCTAEEQRVDKHYGNVICTLPGQSHSTIVIGGHFDFVNRGQGIVDDWSGVSLLPSLYQALKSQPRRHTYVFVAFADEEQGLVGSSRYVKSLTRDQKTLIRAFVNLECLGLAPAKVWMRRSTPELVARLNEVASAVAIQLQGVNVDAVGDDDTHPFASAHIPVISIHSVTQETFPILHSDRDRIEAIHFDDYYSAYKLASYYLAYLDVKTD